MEVMGLMLGDFVDHYTIRCIDVFAMPQSGTVRFISKFFLVFSNYLLNNNFCSDFAPADIGR